MTPISNMLAALPFFLQAIVSFAFCLLQARAQRAAEELEVAEKVGGQV